MLLQRTHCSRITTNFFASTHKNSMQPCIVAVRLKCFYDMDAALICWPMDFWTVTSQRVKVKGVLSNALFSFSRSPRAASPPLFDLFYKQTSQSHHDGRHIIRFADDSVIMSFFSRDDSQHGPVVILLTGENHPFLDINVAKMKEMCTDFRKNHTFIFLWWTITLLNWGLYYEVSWT